jgi:glycine reductase
MMPSKTEFLASKRDWKTRASRKVRKGRQVRRSFSSFATLACLARESFLKLSYRTIKQEESCGGFMQKGKKIIAIGERDGVPGPVIAECLEGAGYEVIFQATECFV